MLKAPLPIPTSDRERRLLEWIARCGVVDFDRVVARFFRAEDETLLEAAPRAESALKRMVHKGYLTSRSIALDGVRFAAACEPRRETGHFSIRAYGVTPRASSSFSLPPPPTLRENFLEHHLKTLDAVMMVEEQQRLRGGAVLEFKLESQLVQESFRGKRFNAGPQEDMPKLPDARLTLQSADGGVEQVNLEYVSSKYTDAMIAAKAEAWRGQSTLWAVPNEAAAARVHAVTGQPAFVV
jgi:hypothetical protein